jgi:Transposase IS4
MSKIMWGIKLVEGSDAPYNRMKEFDDCGGSTVGLLMRLMKPLFYTGMAIVIDSGLCVLKGLLELRKNGIFAAAVIRKHWYWLKYIRGDKLAAYFEDKAFGSYDCIGGTLNNVQFSVHCLKEPDYVMFLMATYGTDKRMSDQGTTRSVKNVDGTTAVVSFNYPELFSYHFKYRNSVYQHNQNRH